MTLYRLEDLVDDDIIEAMRAFDPCLNRLVQRHYYDTEEAYTESGIIGRFLSYFDSETNMFGGGVYSPKWISSHYTLLTLKALEIDPCHPIYRRALARLVDDLWRPLNQEHQGKDQDLCIVAMLVSLMTYTRQADERIDEMIAYILDHTMADGGWNCRWNSKTKPSLKSSLHTSISVLEAFYDYSSNGYTYGQGSLASAAASGEAFILRKKLFRSENSHQVIHKNFLVYHFPVRWKYDVLRALEYFARKKSPYRPELREALEDLIKAFEGGHLAKGPQYPGKNFFPLEEHSGFQGGYFNTYRAMVVLKHFLELRY